MIGQYNPRRVNNTVLIGSWIAVFILALQQYIVRSRVSDSIVFFALGLFYLIPTALCRFRPDNPTIRYWLVFGPIHYIYVVMFIQNGLFDNTFYHCCCIVATAVYFDARLTILTTAYTGITSTLLYAFFKPWFFPSFRYENFVALLLAYLIMGAILSLQTVWSKQLVQNQILLFEKASKDKLTGLFNRSYYDEVLQQRIDAQTTGGSPFALVLIDLDNFKRINDTHGHLRGDAVLVEVAARIRATCRKHDVIARIGGEEFVVLLDDVSEGEAEIVAEKIRIAVFSEPVEGLPCSLSIGVARIRPGEDRQQLFDRADKAMYRAKDGGKNRVAKAE